MSQEFPIAKGKNLTTIEWFNLMSCDLTLEYDCKRISIHEYTARKLELLDRARQMEKEQIETSYMNGCNESSHCADWAKQAEEYYNQTFKK